MNIITKGANILGFACNFVIELCNYATYFDVRDQPFDLAFANDVTGRKGENTRYR